MYGQPASHEFHGPVRARIRRELRLQTTASAATGEPISVLIHNLSQAGMLIETLADLRKGDGLVVELPEGGARAARVVWRGEPLFGCEFEQDLPSATVSAALLRAQFALAREAAEESDRLGAANPLAGDLLPLRARVWIIAALSAICWAVVVAAILWIFG